MDDENATTMTIAIGVSALEYEGLETSSASSSLQTKSPIDEQRLFPPVAAS